MEWFSPGPFGLGALQRIVLFVHTASPQPLVPVLVTDLRWLVCISETHASISSLPLGLWLSRLPDFPFSLASGSASGEQDTPVKDQWPPAFPCLPGSSPFLFLFLFPDFEISALQLLSLL